MYPFSATQAISPALNRTRDLLFRPFRWGNYLKFCAVAVLTEGTWSSLRSHTGGGSGGGGGSHGVPFHIDPGMIAMLVLLAVLLLVLGVVLMYVIVRLRFALFHCLVHRTRELAPAWRLYQQQAMRFFLLSIVVAFGFLALAAVALAPFLPAVMRLIHQSQAAGRLQIADVLPLIVQIVPVMMLLCLAGVAIDVVMRDFMLPHIALENATAGEAWAAALENIAAEKGSFVLYAVLRVLLPIAVGIALTLVLILPAIILFGIPGALFVLVHAAQAHSTGTAWLIAVLLQIVIVLFMIALGAFMAICFGGPVSLAIRNYALVFYGGRYPLLGTLLTPPPPHTATETSPLPA